MDMTVIDTVSADTLQVGDNIQFWDEDNVSLGVQEIRDVDDSGTRMWIISEQGDESFFDFDEVVPIYGYTNEED
jgi:hypothetical protein